MAEKDAPAAAVKDARKPKPAEPVAAKPKTRKAPRPHVVKASGLKEYLVLHRLHHNADELAPGSTVTFTPWPVRTVYVKGKFEVEMASQEAVDAHVAELVANGVVVLNDANAKAALARADAHREAAARKAG